MNTDTRASQSGNDETNHFEQLVEAARAGSADAIGRLIQDCRAYLLSIANQELESDFGAKVGGSDLVQETMLSAQRCLGDFQGQSREELLAWLRGMLINDIKETRRRFRTGRRDVGREQVLAEDSADRRIEQVPAAEATPSTDAITREEAARLQQVLNELSPEDREVIELRNWQRLSFADIGERTGRSAEAARKQWSRAIVRLQNKLEGHRD